jgi:predicted dithiol-disulfide oxidoreductase (DUF899 family)
MKDSLHSMRFPGETSAYRSARNDLLKAEIELRRKLEEVAAKRRELPLGTEPPVDYTFHEEAGPNSVRAVKLSELFQEGQTSVGIYSFMYGPNMKQACSSCTSILDSLDRVAPHATQRIGLAVVAKSPIERVTAFARERNWTNLRLLSSANNMYNRDYHAETLKGEQLPALNVFVRRDGRIHHFYNTELLYTTSEPSQDNRHVDLIWPLWGLFDLTPEGRGSFNPRLNYEAVTAAAQLR